MNQRRYPMVRAAQVMEGIGSTMRFRERAYRKCPPELQARMRAKHGDSEELALECNDCARVALDMAEALTRRLDRCLTGLAPGA